MIIKKQKQKRQHILVRPLKIIYRYKSQIQIWKEGNEEKKNNKVGRAIGGKSFTTATD